MGGEKGASKSGGFFHLFDWNRKSRKKLFSNSPEDRKQGKRANDALPSMPLRLIDEDEIFGIPSLKGSSDYSCASSVTDEEGTGTKAPGVVARLMGLDSMPTSGATEPPYSTPFFDSRLFRGSCSQKQSPDVHLNDQFHHLPQRSESYFRKTIESRSQKMPSSPIERFQTEVLPPRTAKSLPMTHHKLLSPIKNPGYASSKNAAQIMEEAAKFIEPGLQNQANLRGKTSSFGSPSIPLRIRDPKESLAASQRTSRLLQLSRAPPELTEAQLTGGQRLNRNWGNTEDIVIFRSSPDPGETSAADFRGKGKSVSLALQAKVNVQRREGLAASSRSSLVQKEQEQSQLNQPFRSQASNQKNKVHKKSSLATGHGVLRQNNQKQNCSSSKGKSVSKQTVSNQQGRKNVSGDASSGKHKTGNRVTGNTKVGAKKQAFQSAELERGQASSNNKDYPQKKRLIEGSFSNGKSAFAENVVVNRHDVPVQPNVMIDEHAKRVDNSKNGTDIVSFTFTSPLIKPFSKSQSLAEVPEERDKGNGYYLDSFREMNASTVSRNNLSSLRLNALSGDALSHLLEQKLRELTSVIEPSRDFIKPDSLSASLPKLHESKTFKDRIGTVVAEYGQFSHTRSQDKSDNLSTSGNSSNGDQLLAKTHKLTLLHQAAESKESFECSSTSDVPKELDHQNPSPLSILEASFSNGSWQSSESSGSTDGSNLCQSSVQGQNATGSLSSKKVPSGTEVDLSDSASSAFVGESELSQISSASENELNKQDMKYVREIVCNKGLPFKSISSYYLTCSTETVDPLRFDKFECKISKKTQNVEDKANRSKKKALFDCVQEFLDLKCSRYFRAGYQAWAKGMVVIRKDLAEEICQEISNWKSMKDWGADELVDNDMSIHLGRWVDFEIEAFETGKKIQEQILSFLIDEVIADFRVRV